MKTYGSGFSQFFVWRFIVREIESVDICVFSCKSKQHSLWRQIFQQVLVWLFLFFVPHSVWAAWQLDAQRSELYFMSVKNTNVQETHKFDDIQGSVDDKGFVHVDIPLERVNTKIPIRDERLKKILFNTEQFPMAIVSANIDLDKVAHLKVGHSERYDLKFTLSLRGVEQPYKTTLALIKLTDGALSIHNITPVVVDARLFDMQKGIEALRTLAQLSQIDWMVPVGFQMVFTP